MPARHLEALRVKAGANSGLHASDVLWGVVSEGEALVDVQKALAWPARSGKMALKPGLGTGGG